MAGPEVVECDAHAESAQCVEAVDDGIGVVDDVGFRHLEDEAARVEARVAQDGAHAVTKSGSRS